LGGQSSACLAGTASSTVLRPFNAPLAHRCLELQHQLTDVRSSLHPSFGSMTQREGFRTLESLDLGLVGDGIACRSRIISLYRWRRSSIGVALGSCRRHSFAREFWSSCRGMTVGFFGQRSASGTGSIEDTYGARRWWRCCDGAPGRRRRGARRPRQSAAGTLCRREWWRVNWSRVFGKGLKPVSLDVRNGLIWPRLEHSSRAGKVLAVLG
jgi:hypothetical protein